MAAKRLIVLLAILALAVGSLGLMGCSSSDDTSDSTESSSEESDSGQDAGPLMGDWENDEASMFTKITFADGGEGNITQPDGMEAWMTWTLEDDYLEIVVEDDDGTESTGAGFTWVTEGSEFEWDADNGSYTKTR